MTFYVHDCMGEQNRCNVGMYCNTHMHSKWIMGKEEEDIWYKHTLQILCTFQIMQLPPWSKYLNSLGHNSHPNIEQINKGNHNSKNSRLPK